MASPAAKPLAIPLHKYADHRERSGDCMAPQGIVKDLQLLYVVGCLHSKLDTRGCNAGRLFCFFGRSSAA